MGNYDSGEIEDHTGAENQKEDKIEESSTSSRRRSGRDSKRRTKTRTSASTSELGYGYFFIVTFISTVFFVYSYFITFFADLGISYLVAKYYKMPFVLNGAGFFELPSIHPIAFTLAAPLLIGGLAYFFSESGAGKSILKGQFRLFSYWLMVMAFNRFAGGLIVKKVILDEGGSLFNISDQYSIIPRLLVLLGFFPLIVFFTKGLTRNFLKSAPNSLLVLKKNRMKYFIFAGVGPVLIGTILILAGYFPYMNINEFLICVFPFLYYFAMVYHSETRYKTFKFEHTRKIHLKFKWATFGLLFLTLAFVRYLAMMVNITA